MDNEEIIRGLEKIRQNEKSISEIQSDIKELKHKNELLLELSLSVKALVENIGGIKEDVKDIKTNQTNLKDEIKEIRENPNRTKVKVYDKVMVAIISALSTGIIAYVLAQMFPTIFKG